ncbi:MAG: DUF1501 domain-containing protein [Planctomycetota bacterium]|nr:DUF1501 domain-containing protein [Planctomycetota bacterium]MDA1251543.1 DUF1501 domain-containing protein [Planctomycetota bacterium]
MTWLDDQNQEANSFSRRRLLRNSSVAVGAFALPTAFGVAQTARAEQPATAGPPAKRAIVILLQGGCSHLDTWDLKPDASLEIRGEFKQIATSVAGYQCSEHLPLLAQRVHNFNVLRSVYHETPSHEAAIHWVLTGYNYPGANTTTKNRNDKPAMGSIVARTLGSRTPGLPPYVCVPDKGQLGDRVRYASSHFLGMAYDPFESGMPPSDAKSPFQMPPNLSLTKAVDLTRFDHRLKLLGELDQFSRSLDSSDMMSGMSQFNRRAFDMVSSVATRNAFDLSQEPEALRQRYGNTRVGQEAILARRLAEAGVPFTLVNFSINQDWDTHSGGFETLRKTRLPNFDRAISTLLDDLQERGMLDSTLVAVITEFGRTPKINATAGRDHWSDVFSIVLAGGGLKSGQVIGTSNSRGEVPHDRPVHYNDVLATIYQQLGVPTDRVHYDEGRPVPVLYSGKPIDELL